MNRRDFDWADVLMLCAIGSFALLISLELFSEFLLFLAREGV